MLHAAEHREIFHLWWHPEDFAESLDANIRNLREVLRIFSNYHARYGMASMSMSELSMSLAPHSSLVV